MPIAKSFTNTGFPLKTVTVKRSEYFPVALSKIEISTLIVSFGFNSPLEGLISQMLAFLSWGVLKSVDINEDH